MNLTHTLTKLAADFGLDATELINYAAEDTETGWDDSYGAWPNGSIWRVDGQVLYALIRATKPTRLLELGTWHGCSTTHMLLAMKANDNISTLKAVSNVKGAGQGWPVRLRRSSELLKEDIYDWLTSQDDDYDFVFERGSHDSYRVRSIWEQRDRLIKPGGFLISHAAQHHLVGSQVRMGIEATDIVPNYYLTEPGDCGLAIFRADAADVAIDYDAMKYDDLWKRSGPKERNIREQIRSILVREGKRKSAKLDRGRLIGLLKASHDTEFVDENGDGIDDRTVTSQLEAAQNEGKRKATRMKNGDA